MPAILDLGTNTFHLLIASYENNEVHERYQEQIPVKIGAGGIQNGIITPEAWQRAMDALRHFHTIIQQYSENVVLATGTSAIRNARNGKEFLDSVRTEFGFEVQQISGSREAELIYLGVRHSHHITAEPMLVMDIGGGSVEFIIGKGENIYWKQSFEIGAARLLQMFNPSDPIDDAEEAAIMRYLTEQLQPLKSALEKYRETEQINILTGAAGSFETFRDVMAADLHLPLPPLGDHAFEASGKQLEQYLNFMICSSLAQRKNMQGLVDFRQDMIVVASLLMKWVWQECNLQECIVSNYALKEGLLINISQQD